MEQLPLTSLEKVPTEVFTDAHDASVAAAKTIAKLIREKAGAGKTCVLGLATGSTPLGVYNELVRMHQEEGLSFKNVITFNLELSTFPCTGRSCRATGASCMRTCST